MGIQEFVYFSTVKFYYLPNIPKRTHYYHQSSQLKSREMHRMNNNNFIPSNAPISILFDEQIDVKFTSPLHSAILPASDMQVDEFKVNHNSINARLQMFDTVCIHS